MPFGGTFTSVYVDIFYLLSVFISYYLWGTTGGYIDLPFNKIKEHLKPWAVLRKDKPY